MCESKEKLVSSLGEPLGPLIHRLSLLEKHMPWLEATWIVKDFRTASTGSPGRTCWAQRKKNQNCFPGLCDMELRTEDPLQPWWLWDQTWNWWEWDVQPRGEGGVWRVAGRDRYWQNGCKHLLKTDHTQFKGWNTLNTDNPKRRKKGKVGSPSSNSFILELIKCESLSSWFTDVRKDWLKSFGFEGGSVYKYVNIQLEVKRLALDPGSTHVCFKNRSALQNSSPFFSLWTLIIVRELLLF